ncbi:MAG TPA: SDR family oxidoreductase [Gemmatimonadaceae bacterium]|nr:SDR family oxidoreductase [Gemmatimonadaceae bacterium]
MAVRQKQVKDQVIVITGASSGIGLATAKEAAARGARVVLNSRDPVDLSRAVQEIREDGGDCVMHVGDVADRSAMEGLADTAIAAYRRIDTWINNAGVSIYGEISEVKIEDARRLFDTNYWGVVNGSLVAVEHLETFGGTLINVGSVLSETAYPLQGHYAASKHAVKGFTDSLRIELEKKEAPIIVTLIQPAAIDTPYPEHARNYLPSDPSHEAPVYKPEVVADAILACAEKPHRNLRVGGSAKLYTAMEKVTPGLADRKKMSSFEAQMSSRPAHIEGALFAPVSGDLAVRGNFPGRVRGRSIYTKAALHPMAALAGVAALGVSIAVALRGRDN